ncbi:E3 ubiquitin-protein ligase DDB_G0292642-like isoform X2 [Paralichthys olivaceus]|nr:PREDICTED: potential E3 ubiquitin-protein ligase ariadne-2-like [Paralichthys olivaceus]
MFSRLAFEMLKVEKEKKYNPKDPTMTLVDRKDDLDPVSSEDGDGGLRAVMSCGHAVTAESLTQWCRSRLDQGIYKFTCPALVEGTKLCNKEWSYIEVRRLAILSVSEMKKFERTMARMTAAEHCDIQQCPQCKTCVERKDLSNLCVVCIICSADQKTPYHFCWQCQRKWKGHGPRSDRCANDGCANKDLQLLQTCRTINLPDVKGVTNCPSVRACPTCGLKVEHNKQYCKNIECPRCHVPFCFLCLKLKRECNKTSSPYKICPGGVAPRQTSIPVWQRK